MNNTRKYVKDPRFGEVWLADIEYGVNGDRNHVSKKRPVIVLAMSGGTVTYYPCTTNDFRYDRPKYRMKEPFKAGLVKDEVYVQMEENGMPVKKLDTFVGRISKSDIEGLLNFDERFDGKKQ